MSNEGDIVLDPFCGSGTTLAASMRLKRRFFGVDVRTSQVQLSHKRIIETIVDESIGRSEKATNIFIKAIEQEPYSVIDYGVDFSVTLDGCVKFWVTLENGKFNLWRKEL